MLSTASSSALMRLYGNGPDFAYIGDVMFDALAAMHVDFVGQMTLIANDAAMNPGIEPPQYPNLDHDFATVLKIVHVSGFQQPGDVGPHGGTAMTVRGPCQFVPNRDGDVTIDSPYGTIKAKRLFAGGEEVVIFPAPPSSGSYLPKSVDGVISWVAVNPC